MRRDRRLLVVAVLAAITVSAGAATDGRRWEAGRRWQAGRPIQPGLAAPVRISSADRPLVEPVGRRWS